MKKTRLLIATLVCAVMLMGVGYAWWNDTLVIGATAKTGSFDVSWITAGEWAPTYGGSEYVRVKDKVAEAKLISCTFENLYPGASGRIDAVALNNSTIAAMVDKVTIEVTADEQIAPYLKGYAEFYKRDVNGDFVANSYVKTATVALDQLAAELNSNSVFKGMRLEPGESLKFGAPNDENACVVILLDESAPNNDTENKTVSYEMTIDWKQFNQY